MKVLNEYEKLLEVVYNGRNRFREEDLNVFNCAKGCNYENQFLVVGRAVNGWNKFHKNEALHQINEVKRNLQHDLQ